MLFRSDLLISVQAIEPLKIPIPNIETNAKIENLIDSISIKSIFNNELKINELIYSLYALSVEEIEFIESL